VTTPRPIDGAVLRSKAVPAVASTRRFGLIAAQCGVVLIGLGGLGDQAVQKLMPTHEAFLGVVPGRHLPRWSNSFSPSCTPLDSA
jgi:hypothetical protein